MMYVGATGTLGRLYICILQVIGSHAAENTNLENHLLIDVNNYRRLTNDLSTTKTKLANGLLTDQLNFD